MKLGVVEKLHISKHSTSFGPEENQIFFKQTASKIYGALDALQDNVELLDGQTDNKDFIGSSVKRGSNY